MWRTYVLQDKSQITPNVGWQGQWWTWLMNSCDLLHYQLSPSDWTMYPRNASQPSCQFLPLVTITVEIRAMLPRGPLLIVLVHSDLAVTLDVLTLQLFSSLWRYCELHVLTGRYSLSVKQHSALFSGVNEKEGPPTSILLGPPRF